MFSILVHITHQQFSFNNNNLNMNTDVICMPKGTFTHARSRGGWKIGFNTNHYVRSHICGRGVSAKSAPQEMGPTRNFPCPFQNRLLRTIFFLRKWQIRSRLLRVCLNIHAVAERECQNLPLSTLDMCERNFIVIFVHKLMMPHMKTPNKMKSILLGI